MKYIQTIMLAAVALLIASSSASATTITSSEGTTFTLKASSEGTVSFHGTFTTVTCKSSLEGKVNQHSGTNTALLEINSLTFTDCNYPVSVLKKGFFEVHRIVGSTGDGTLTWSGVEITMQTSVGNCLWGTAGTHIGLVTGSATANDHATHHINSAFIPRVGHSFLCGSGTTWTGNYKITSPTGIYID